LLSMLLPVEDFASIEPHDRQSGNPDARRERNGDRSLRRLWNMQRGDLFRERHSSGGRAGCYR
jgi:hypothetical protein